MTVEEVLVVGRGVYALPLLRILKASNDIGTSGDVNNSKINVTFATSVGWRDLGSVSRCVDEVVHIPRADQDLEGFTTALCGIVRRKQNLLILPVVEETLFLSLPKVVNRIHEAATAGQRPRILTSSYQVLTELNDKFQFQKQMAKIFAEENVPQTSLVNSEKDLLESIKKGFERNSAASKVVVKPVSGHGSLGAHLVSREDVESLSSEELLKRYPVPWEKKDSAKILTVPYVVQEFVEGTEYSTFSLVNEGTVMVHVCYEPRQVSTHGFSPIRDLAPQAVYQKSLEYVQKVASSLNLTGHFGFDMMQQFTGEFVALECNPRVTNGMAFLSPRFSKEIAYKVQQAYLGNWEKNDKLISPMDNSEETKMPHHIMTTIATISSVSKAKNSSERMRLLEVASQSYDDIWLWNDPLPLLMMVFRFTGALLLTILRQLVHPIVDEQGKRLKASDIIRNQVVSEIVHFNNPAAASKQAIVTETVGGLPQLGKSTKEREKGRGLSVLVTGATGFLGGKVVRALHQGWDDQGIPLPEGAEAVTEVTATGRDKERGTNLIQSLKQDSKVKTQFVAADLTNACDTYAMIQGHDVVIHCAALCSLWTRWDDYMAANVKATENIAQACRLNGVRLLVHVSSPSICTEVNPTDQFDIKETDPLPSDDKQPNRYSATKKMAEMIVDDISRRYDLPCIILRPRAIFGPGDTTLFPLLLDKLKSGKLPVVGKGRECLADYTYVDNVVNACLCCLDKQPTGCPSVYSITNDDPRRLWDIIDRLCKHLKLKKPWKRIPRFAAFYVAYALEGISALLMLLGYKKTPLFTRYTVNVVSRSSTFDISAAKQELGYRPIISFDEGCERFLRSLEQ